MNYNTIIIDGVEYKTGDKVSCYLRTTGDVEQSKYFASDSKIYITNKECDSGIKCFICQNLRNGDDTRDKLGYNYSWGFYVKDGKHSYSVSKLQKVEKEPEVEAEPEAVPDREKVLVDGVNYYHGDIVEFTINTDNYPEHDGKVFEAVLYVEDSESFFLCQDYFDGAGAPDRFGKDYSWIIRTDGEGNIDEGYEGSLVYMKHKTNPEATLPKFKVGDWVQDNGEKCFFFCDPEDYEELYQFRQIEEDYFNQVHLKYHGAMVVKEVKTLKRTWYKFDEYGNWVTGECLERVVTEQPEKPKFKQVTIDEYQDDDPMPEDWVMTEEIPADL